jgi:hypothetical protein
MKVWLAGIAVLLLLAACSDSDEEVGTSKPVVTASSSPVRTIPTPPASASPTPTAPGNCGSGSGTRDQCAKTAVEPAFEDYKTRFVLPSPNELVIFSEERVDWPDSCLGVSQPDAACAQVITPGFRFVITGAPGSPYAEYHTDLAGHWVFDTWYALFSGGTPTPAP